MPFKYLSTIFLSTAVLISHIGAQQTAPAKSRLPGALGVEEATTITQGWALVTQGLYADAAAKATKALTENPRGAAALVLAVEVEMARGGSQAALAQYERWLGQRTWEEPAVLRRIAQALLREAAQDRQHDAARIEALRALASDGDAGASAELTNAASKGGVAEVRMAAIAGDERSVKVLADQLRQGATNALGVIEALGKSRNRAAVPPLVERLKDPSPEIRGAAAEALGNFGPQPGLVDRIKPLLSDQTSYVRVKAAGTLFRLDDMSGLQLLQELAASEVPMSRLMAAQAMASKPDAVWLEHVRKLASAAEPEVRVGAARLLAPHDPEYARTVLEGVMADQNPAIRNLASEILADVAATDPRSLRRLLKSDDRLTRVRAAGHLLALTR
jgi:HEAT repeat protein